MLTALDYQGQKTIAWLASKGAEYKCPKCAKRLMLKMGTKVIWHFAHYPDSNCPLSKGESLRHMEMKQQVGRLFKSVEYEVSLIPERRADIVVFKKFVVECQDSPISIDEWLQRTKDYNKAGLPVLWVWNLSRITLSKDLSEFSLLSYSDECRVPLEIRYCHRFTYGRVYALDKTGTLMACHLETVSSRDNEWYDEDGECRSSSYTPKSLRQLDFQTTPLRPRVMTNGNLRLIGLGEGRWWK